ncbi:hypothetical protein TNCV_4935181 [Trichonephila clavipes]|uniref:Uncharacterized protein n=1 Tax=Trichonephila clavipes TaxID=2585209 RepID=A0A8X6VGV4_TRICX|nr:hypothetical protein TNCV_4935181 [Trichonephila clavipes]
MINSFRNSMGLAIEISSRASTGLGFCVDVMSCDAAGLGSEQIKNALCPVFFRAAFYVLLLHYENDEGTDSPLPTHLVVQNTERQFRQPLVPHYMIVFEFVLCPED